MKETKIPAGRRSRGLVVLEGVASNLLFGSLLVWSVLRNPLLELFPDWNEGMLSFIFGMHNLFTCLGILLGGFLCRRLPTRRVYLIFALMASVGLAGFGLLPPSHPSLAYGMAFFCFCVLAATGVGIGINVVQSTTIPWFPKNSGAISGALYMALGTSSILLAALAQALLPAVGVLGLMPVFGAIVLVVAAAVLADRRSICPPRAEDAPGAEGEGLRTGEMLRTPAFWVLLLWNVCLRTAGLTLIDHAASIAAAFGGFALTAMLIAPANGLGSLTVGVAYDRFGRRRIMLAGALVMLAAAGLLCAGVGTGSYPLILPGLLLGGFAYGGSSSTYVASVKNRFGTRFYTQNFAVSNLAVGAAALLESVSGTVLDRSGGYLAVMGMVLLLAVCALVLSALTKKARV